MVSRTRREEPRLVEGNLGEEQDLRRRIRGRCREPARSGDPAGVAPHHLEHEHLVEVLAIEATSNAASRIDVATYFATEPKPGQVSVSGEIVVDGLRHADAGDRITERRRDLRHLEAVSAESLPPL